MKVKQKESITCRICKTKAQKKFEAEIMGKYLIGYYFCENCKYMQTEEPYWLDESYNSPMNITDTGVIQRNIDFSKTLSFLLYSLFPKDAKFLDFAGGYGLFTRMMRDIGFDYYWDDIYTDNLVARGFEYDSGMDISLLTAFETFEHLVDPLADIGKMFEITDTIVFSTLLLPDGLPGPDSFWYYCLDHGQHVGIMTRSTLEYIAQQFGARLYTNNSDFHMLTKKEYFIPNVIEKRFYDYHTDMLIGDIKSEYEEDDWHGIQSGSPKQVAKGVLTKAFDWYKGRSYLIRKEGIETEKVAKEEKFLSEYINYLLSHKTSQHEQYIRDHLESKTFSDHQMLEKLRIEANKK